MAGAPGTQTSTSRSRADAGVGGVAGVHQAAADRVGAGGDDDDRVGHRLAGAQQRGAHRRGADAGDEQDVGVRGGWR